MSAPSRAAGRPGTPAGRWSTPSSTRPATGASGGPSRTTCRRTGSCSTTSGCGRRTGRGTASTTPSARRSARPPGSGRSRRWRSWTARRSRGPSTAARTGTTGGKKVAGRKRFVAVDTLGLLWALMVVPADTQDRAGGPKLMDRLRGAVKRLKVVWGDTHFDTALAHGWVRWGWVGVVVKKLAGQAGFVVQPKRWIVERTFGWLGRSRRLSKEYERTPDSSEAFIKVAMIHLMVRRLRH